MVPLELEEPLDELLELLDEPEPLELLELLLPELLELLLPELLELLPEELDELLEPKPGVPLGPQAERVSNRKATYRQFPSFIGAAKFFSKMRSGSFSQQYCRTMNRGKTPGTAIFSRIDLA